jgi:hypothetical protein
MSDRYAKLRRKLKEVKKRLNEVEDVVDECLFELPFVVDATKLDTSKLEANKLGVVRVDDKGVYDKHGNNIFEEK